MNTTLTLCDAYTIATDDDHVAVRIVKTGWPDKYHVIIEDAVYGSKMLSDPLTSEEIEQKYGHKMPDPVLQKLQIQLNNTKAKFSNL